MCFDSLLADRQGIELFRKYLENVQDKQGTKLIGMWLIYEGKFIKIIFVTATVPDSLPKPLPEPLSNPLPDLSPVTNHFIN